MHATVTAVTETGKQSPIWERIDKPGANVRHNVPQPTGIKWDSPLQAQDPAWLIGEEGESDPMYPVEQVLNYDDGDILPIRVRNREAPPFGEWRRLDE